MLTDILAFVATWTLMMAAMMLPSLLPSIALFGTVSKSREPLGFRAVPSPIFAIGYFVAWALIGVVVAVAGQSLGPVLGEHRRIVVGGALAFAGAYQLTPFKARCLGHCRSPLHFFMDHWRDGLAGAVRVGIHHGFYCVGCCAGLMLALIALGMMTPAWMVAVGLVIFVEKVLPYGDRVPPWVGVVLIAAGIGVLTGLVPAGPSPMHDMPMGEMNG